MTDVPTFADLPRNRDGVPEARGTFGPRDELGSLNHQTPQRVVAAAQEVRTGKVFALNAEISAFVDDRAGRPAAERIVTHRPGYFDDYVDHFALQGSSQWDSLGHVGYGADEFYNGATEAEVASGARNAIDAWARRGIAGRGVLLDMVRYAEARGSSLAPDRTTGFSPADLEGELARVGASLQPGDVLLLRTGFAPWYAGLSGAERNDVELAVPGLEHSREVCEFLWDHRVSAVVSDNYSVEAWPPDWSAEAFPWGQLHVVLIGTLGLALGEMWWLEELADDCAADGRATCLVTSAPLNVRGAHGSPANALALK